jgi:hypothetical protein
MSFPNEKLKETNATSAGRHQVRLRLNLLRGTQAHPLL